ncbi:MAG: alpha/beta hydrolase [Saprospiraceae bacterium]|nr:alpha/beta hydrolase [Saprospiraceae bacterium]
MKFNFKIIKRLLIIGFLLLNVIAYNHAYKFTHFTKIEGERVKPENLSLSSKVKVLFFGVDNYRPINNQTPEKPYQTVTIQSRKSLECWMVEVENSKGIVVLFHGYSGNKAGNVSYSNAFNEMAYSTLLVDFMGSGGSEGNQTTVGFKESQDVKAVFDYVKKTFPNEKIILFGSSMGAVSIMKSIADYSIQPNKIILECPFGNMRKTVKKRFEAMNIPSFPFADMLMFYGGIQNGFNAYQHKATEYAKEIDMPVLLLYGAKDERVTLEETNDIFDGLKGKKELVILEKSAHQNYLINDEKVWFEAMKTFL